MRASKCDYPKVATRTIWFPMARWILMKEGYLKQTARQSNISHAHLSQHVLSLQPCNRNFESELS